MVSPASSRRLGKQKKTRKGRIELVEIKEVKERTFPEVYAPTAAELKRAGFTGKALSKEEYTTARGKLRKSVLGDLSKAERIMRLRELHERHKLTPEKLKKKLKK